MYNLHINNSPVLNLPNKVTSKMSPLELGVAEEYGSPGI